MEAAMAAAALAAAMAAAMAAAALAAGAAAAGGRSYDEAEEKRSKLTVDSLELLSTPRVPELAPSPGSNRCGGGRGGRRCPVPNAEPVPTPAAPAPPAVVLEAVAAVFVVVVVVEEVDDEDVPVPAAGCVLEPNDNGDDDLSEDTEERASSDLSSARLLNAVP